MFLFMEEFKTNMPVWVRTKVRITHAEAYYYVLSFPLSNYSCYLHCLTLEMWFGNLS